MSEFIFEQGVDDLTRLALRFSRLHQACLAYGDARHSLDARTGLDSLVAALSLLDRPELRSKCLQEIRRLMTQMSRWRDNPDSDVSTLNDIMAKLDNLESLTIHTPGKFADTLRQNPFIKTISQENSEAYWDWWQQQPLDAKCGQLADWQQSFNDFATISSTLIELQRMSTPPQTLTANGGFLQMPLEYPNNCRLIRVFIPAGMQLIPRISTGRHGVSIRFNEAHTDSASVPVQEDISFRLACCQL